MPPTQASVSVLLSEKELEVARLREQALNDLQSKVSNACCRCESAAASLFLLDLYLSCSSMTETSYSWSHTARCAVTSTPGRLLARSEPAVINTTTSYIFACIGCSFCTFSRITNTTCSCLTAAMQSWRNMTQSMRILRKNCLLRSSLQLGFAQPLLTLTQVKALQETLQHASCGPGGKQECLTSINVALPCHMWSGHWLA